MKPMVRNAGGLITGLLALAVGYYTVAVVSARAETPRIIEEAMRSGHFRLALSDLSSWQIKILLAIEDPKFYSHHGIDLKTPGAGLTTITQGLGKILYFHPFKPGIRKIQLMLLAWLVLDPMISKDEQLLLFINQIYLGKVAGKPVTGFAEAAEVYYHKKVAELTEYEYSSLVAMIISPQGFHIFNHPAANAERTRRILKVVSGEYQPKNLMDMFYGPLDPETQKDLAPASYFKELYQNVEKH